MGIPNYREVLNQGVVCPGPCRVFAWDIYNPNTVPVYIKFYDLSGAALPVPATDKPKLFRGVPAIGGDIEQEQISGAKFAFDKGCKFFISTGDSDSDATAPAKACTVAISYVQWI